jgi:hypothetical protein
MPIFLNRRRQFLSIVAFLALTLASSAFAQLPDQQKPQPSDVSLQVTTGNGTTTFHIGEVIPLELNFTSTSPHLYILNMAGYDRSGRMNHDAFVVMPDAGWADPLRSYIHPFGGFMGGGLSNSEYLSATPTTINLQLNEWVQFTAPGKYSITVRSSRVGRRSLDSANLFGESVPVTSQTLLLTIVAATREWQQETLQQAKTDLASSAPTGMPDEQRLRGAKTLRYLGSLDSTKELARRLRGRENDFDFDFMFGLIASPEQEVARAEMRRLLFDSDFPVSSMFLSALAIVCLHPDETYEVHLKNYQNAYKAASRELIESLAKKRGDALPASLFTALNQVSPEDNLPEETSRRLSSQLVAVFDRLPVERQSELIEYRWQSVGSAAWLPVFRKLADHYEDFPEQNASTAYSSLHLTAVALRRWYEIAPGEARPAILREILRPHPRFGATVLGILPDKTLPDAENTLYENFAAVADDQGPYEVGGNIASLIQRYATPAILSRMLVVTDRNVGHWACMEQEPVLAYLLGADPVAARPRIEAGIAARGGEFTACSHSLLGMVGQLHLDPVLNEIALRTLNDDDPEVAGNAAGFLGRYGDASVEQTLWEHLTKWNATWHRRETELAYDTGGANPNLSQYGLGQNLQMGIASGHAWLADKNKLLRLQQLSVGAQMRNYLDNILPQWDAKPWGILYLDDSVGGPTFNVLQYDLRSLDALKRKLSQFPAGSSFSWNDSQPTSDSKKLAADLSIFLQEHGMSLQIPTPQTSTP